MLGLVPILLLSFSVSMSNFFASVGIGLTRAGRGTVVRALALFGLFELVMPIVGLAIGVDFSSLFVAAGRYLGAGLLFALGAYSILRSGGSSRRRVNYASGNRGLVLIAFALSIDNLVVGFAFGSYHLPILVATAFIAAVSVSLSALGFGIGRLLGKRVVRWEGGVLGAVLVLVGLFVLLG